MKIKILTVLFCLMLIFGMMMSCDNGAPAEFSAAEKDYNFDKSHDQVIDNFFDSFIDQAIEGMFGDDGEPDQ